MSPLSAAINDATATQLWLVAIVTLRRKNDLEQVYLAVSGSPQIRLQYFIGDNGTEWYTFSNRFEYQRQNLVIKCVDEFFSLKTGEETSKHSDI